MALADIQRTVRDAMVAGAPAPDGLSLVGGREPARRVLLHRRHYRASLVETLLRRYPALTWLAGGRAVTAAADIFISAHPPAAPCLADYGEGFPPFVARQVGDAADGYIATFGELEWHVGAVSIAVDVPVAPIALEALDGDALASSVAIVQPGVRYVRSGWPVHDLLERFLTDSVPDSYALVPADTWIEVRGARGRFEIHALDDVTWTFRRALQAGLTIEQAYVGALALDDTFDLAAAFRAVIASGLLGGLATSRQGAFR